VREGDRGPLHRRDEGPGHAGPVGRGPHRSGGPGGRSRRPVHFRYSSAVQGFAATLNDSALAALRSNPNAAFVEADAEISISEDQTNAAWGLDRIDQRNLPLNSIYHYDRTGSGVRAYIIDTGILSTHSQFSGRTAAGFSAITGGTTDCNGHGTHVAGTVGGTIHGVAKCVTLVTVRVLNCSGSGSTSGVIAGVDFVTSNHTSGPAVANMSLGGGVSTALDAAVTNSINDGVVYAVAAGNESTNACNGSPSRVGPALTVGATTSTDARSSFSNFGSCVDLFAPGSSITSAWYVDLRIDSAETTTTTAFERLSVQIVSGGTTTTLAKYSNLNENTSYVQRTFNLNAFVGRTVTLRFTGTEDASLQTSFVIDDTAITTA
jgi:subtilisin family serine protease